MADTITDPIDDTAMSDVLRYVFVYGTLRLGEQRDINLLLPTPLFIGYGQTPGVLYDLGAYPGVRLGGSQFVRGEVYQIGLELERQLDAIEEVWPQQTGEYTRQEVRVAFTGASIGSGPGAAQTCLVYEIADKRISGMPVIASGDWFDRQP
jgi:gamma-glutamylcyclotransferase (GGCT)/AIG2-like uncharacterized protein YtfP